MTKFLVILGVLVSVFLMACGSSAEVSRTTDSLAAQNNAGGATGDRDGFLAIGPPGAPGPEGAVTAESKAFGGLNRFPSPNRNQTFLPQHILIRNA